MNIIANQDNIVTSEFNLYEYKLGSVTLSWTV